MEQGHITVKAALLSQLMLGMLLNTIQALYATSSPQNVSDNDPALQAYQNERDCFPFNETWYVMYRNYKYDPYFGFTGKCITITETSQFEGNTATFSVTYRVGPKTNVKVTLMSSPGYSKQNVLHVEILLPGPLEPLKNLPPLNFNLTTAFKDCSKCQVFRHSYIPGGGYTTADKNCALWQPKSAIGENIPCCDFVFDLVCGVSPKFQVYEDCLEDSAIAL